MASSISSGWEKALHPLAFALCRAAQHSRVLTPNRSPSRPSGTLSTTGTPLRSPLVALILLAVVGCDSGEVDVEDFVGSYQTEAFTTSAGGGTFDVRANGGDISLTINADGTF